MSTHNPDVLHPTRGTQAHLERLQALERAEQTIRELFKFYEGLPLLKKDLVDAVAFAEGCAQETAQGYVDALSSIHPRSPFVTHEVNKQAHVFLKDPQLLAEDAGTLAPLQHSQQPPKKHNLQKPKKAKKGGANV